jgi:hypothetical protein
VAVDDGRLAFRVADGEPAAAAQQSSGADATAEERG